MDSIRLPRQKPADASVINRNWYVWAPMQAWYLNPDRVGVSEYLRMMQTDETVSSGVEFVTLAVLARLGEYTHEDADITEFVRDAFNGMRGTLNQCVGEMLSALWAGFSVTEILWRVSGREVTLDGLATLHPLTVQFELEQGGPTSGQVARIVQFANTAQEVEIPREKAVVFSHKGSFGNLYGTSRLKAAFKSWYYKEKLLQYWGLTLERYGVPLAKANVQNPDAVVTLDNGTPMRHADYVGKTLEQMRAGSALVFDDQTEVEFLQTGRALGADFQAAIEYHNKMIYRALLLPSLVADNGSVGSYSLGQQHFDMFTLTLDSLIVDLGDVLIEQLVRRLVELNFGPQDDYGSFASEPYVAEDQKALSDVFLALTNAGYISPTNQDDLNAVRERFGFGEKEVEEPSIPAALQPGAVPPVDPNADGASPPDPNAAATPPNGTPPQGPAAPTTSAPTFVAMRENLLADLGRRMRPV